MELKSQPSSLHISMPFFICIEQASISAYTYSDYLEEMKNDYKDRPEDLLIEKITSFPNGSLKTIRTVMKLSKVTHLDPNQPIYMKQSGNYHAYDQPSEYLTNSFEKLSFNQPKTAMYSQIGSSFA